MFTIYYNTDFGWRQIRVKTEQEAVRWVARYGAAVGLDAYYEKSKR